MEKTIEMLSIESNNLLAIQNIPIGLKIETSQNPIHDILLDFKAKKEKNKKRTSPIKSSHNTKRSSNSSKAQKPAPKIDKRYDENEDNISLNQESSMKPPPFIPNSEESEQTLTLSEIEQSDFTLSILQQAIDNSHQAEANDTNKKSEKKKNEKKTNKKNKNTKSQKPKQVNNPEKERVAINDTLPLLKTEENSQNPPPLLPESPHSSELQTKVELLDNKSESTEVIHKIRYATPEEIAEGKTTTYTYEYISTDSTDSKDDQNQINYQQDLDLQTAPIIDKDNENQFVEEEASENSLQKSLDLSDDIELSSNLNQENIIHVQERDIEIHEEAQKQEEDQRQEEEDQKQEEEIQSYDEAMQIQCDNKQEKKEDSCFAFPVETSLDDIIDNLLNNLDSIILPNSENQSKFTALSNKNKSNSNISKDFTKSKNKTNDDIIDYIDFLSDNEIIEEEEIIEYLEEEDDIKLEPQIIEKDVQLNDINNQNYSDRYYSDRYYSDQYYSDDDNVLSFNSSIIDIPLSIDTSLKSTSTENTKNNTLDDNTLDDNTLDDNTQDDSKLDNSADLSDTTKKTFIEEESQEELKIINPPNKNISTNNEDLNEEIVLELPPLPDLSTSQKKLTSLQRAKSVSIKVTIIEGCKLPKEGIIFCSLYLLSNKKNLAKTRQLQSKPNVKWVEEFSFSTTKKNQDSLLINITQIKGTKNEILGTIKIALSEFSLYQVYDNWYNGNGKLKGLKLHIQIALNDCEDNTSNISQDFTSSAINDETIAPTIETIETNNNNSLVDTLSSTDPSKLTSDLPISTKTDTTINIESISTVDSKIKSMKSKQTSKKHSNKKQTNKKQTNNKPANKPQSKSNQTDDDKSNSNTSENQFKEPINELPESLTTVSTVVNEIHLDMHSNQKDIKQNYKSSKTKAKYFKSRKSKK